MKGNLVNFPKLLMSQRQAALKIARQYLNHPRLKRIIRGERNIIYLASDGEQKLIIRLAEKQSFGHSNIPRFQRSSRAAKAALSAGLKTYRIIKTGIKDLPYAYQITEYIDGIPGDELNAKDEYVWEQIGKSARQINQVKTPGIGENPFEKPNLGWTEFISGKINEVMAFYRNPSKNLVKRNHVFEEWELRVFERLMKPLYRRFSDFRLIHSDLGPHNVLFSRDGEIAAVLDWDHAKSFPAAYQVAVCTFWNNLQSTNGQARQKAFLKGYAKSVDADLVRAFQIYEFLTQMPFHTHKRAVMNRLRAIAGIGKLNYTKQLKTKGKIIVATR